MKYDRNEKWQRKKRWKPLYKNMLNNKPANKQWIRQNQINNTKQQVIPSLDGMGHHVLAWRSTSLERGSYGSMGGWMRGRVNGLRRKWSQGTHLGSITVCKEGMF